MKSFLMTFKKSSSRPWTGAQTAYMPLRPLVSYNELVLVLMMAAVGLVMRAASEFHEQ